MSEEEIIKILNSYTTDLYHSYKEDVILKAIRGLLDLYNNLKEIEEEHRKENGMLHNIINRDQQDLNIYKELLRQEKEMYKNTGKIVKNKRDGKVGVVLREFETGQIQVLEKIGDKGGKVINTHDSWKTLELLEEEV